MSGGGSQSQNTNTVSEVKIPPELLPFVKTQARVGTNALKRQEQQLRGAGADELISPFTPLQEQGFQAAQDAIGPDGIIPQVTQQLQGTAAGDFQFGNPAFDEAVQASIRAAQPAILSSFGRAGGTPGGLAQAAIQQVASDSFANLFGQERARQQQAQLALPQLSLIPSDILSGIGGEQQALAQRQLTAPLTANEILQQAAGGGVPLGSLLGQTGNQTSSRSGGGSGLASGLGGGLLGLSLLQPFFGGGGGGAGVASSAAGGGVLGTLGAGTAGLFGSDRRIKKEIRRVGTLDNGLPVYAFKYKAGGPTQIGVMAQDVEKVKPEAVVEVEGVKMVHYDQAVA